MATSGKLNEQRPISCQVVAFRFNTFFHWTRFIWQTTNCVPFDSTTPIYIINLLWKVWLGLGLDLQLHYFRIFSGE